MNISYRMDLQELLMEVEVLPKCCPVEAKEKVINEMIMKRSDTSKIEGCRFKSRKG